MCMCGKPTANGTPGYSWDGKQTSTRPVDPPAIEDRDQLLFDEPGRCGGLDAHCHHYRIVLRYGQLFLLVRHGGGDERIPLSQCNDNLKAMLLSMDSNTRFWFLNSLYHTIYRHTEEACKKVRREWSEAFVAKRIKKQKRKGTIRVWIERADATQG